MEAKERSRSRSPFSSRSNSPRRSLSPRRKSSVSPSRPQRDFENSPRRNEGPEYLQRNEGPTDYGRNEGYSRGYGYAPRGYDRNNGRGGYDRGYEAPYHKPKSEVIKGSDQDRSQSTCLYIGNLPYTFNQEDVIQMFEKCGKIASCSVPLDKFTQRNKGFAFLAFENREHAEDAKNMFAGYPVDGRKLRIDWDVGRDKKEVVKQGFEPRDGYEYERQPYQMYDRGPYGRPRYDQRYDRRDFHYQDQDQYQYPPREKEVSPRGYQHQYPTRDKYPPKEGSPGRDYQQYPPRDKYPPKEDYQQYPPKGYPPKGYPPKEGSSDYNQYPKDNYRDEQRY